MYAALNVPSVWFLDGLGIISHLPCYRLLIILDTDIFNRLGLHRYALFWLPTICEVNVVGI